MRQRYSIKFCGLSDGNEITAQTQNRVNTAIATIQIGQVITIGSHGSTSNEPMTLAIRKCPAR